MNFKVSEIVDDVQDVSYLGDFVNHRPSNENVPCYIDRMTNILYFNNGESVGAPFYLPNKPYGGDDRYYVPYNHTDFEQEWDHVSQEDKDKVIEEYGSIKNACVNYIYKDLERLLDYHNGIWCMIIIYVSVTVEGVEYSDCLGGVENDGGEDYFNELVNDLKSNVLQQVDDEIERLNHEVGKLVDARHDLSQDM